MTSKITVSLPYSLLAVLDRLAKQWATTRSGAVAELLRRVEQEEMAKELAEGYSVWAERNRKEAEALLPAQAEAILREWGQARGDVGQRAGGFPARRCCSKRCGQQIQSYGNRCSNNYGDGKNLPLVNFP